MAGLQTEFDFVLPKGYVDTEGNLHRKGTMRLATAMDEIAPMRDPRVRANQAYLSIILLARVITKLGTLGSSEISTGAIEHMFSSDLAYLQSLYNRINSSSGSEEGSACTTCGRKLIIDAQTGQEAAVQPTNVGG